MCAEPIAAAKQLSIARHERGLDAGFRIRSEDALLAEPWQVTRVDHRACSDQRLDDWRIVDMRVVVDRRPEYVSEHGPAPGVLHFERSSTRHEEAHRLDRSCEGRQM